MYIVSKKTDILTLKRDWTLKDFFFIFLDFAISPPRNRVSLRVESLSTGSALCRGSKRNFISPLRPKENSRALQILSALMTQPLGLTHPLQESRPAVARIRRSTCWLFSSAGLDSGVHKFSNCLELKCFSAQRRQLCQNQELEIHSFGDYIIPNSKKQAEIFYLTLSVFLTLSNPFPNNQRIFFRYKLLTSYSGIKKSALRK